MKKPILTLSFFITLFSSTAQTGLISYPTTTNNDAGFKSGIKGNYNSFFGALSGFKNTTGNQNAFFGYTAGYGNVTGSFNTFIGYNSNPSTSNLTSATAIGANASVGCSNCLVLGQNANVGIGTSKPLTLLSLGNGLATKKLALYDNASSWYGFGIQSGQMRLQVGNDNARFSFFAGDTKEVMTIFGNGKVGIGTTAPQSELAVKGTITAQEVEVTINGWADYVFQKDYFLKPLHEVEQFIKENKHLPEVPSEKEVKEKGNNLGKMDAVLLQKIEELTLYVIDQNKSIEALKKENIEFRKTNQELNNRLLSLEKQ